MAAAEFPTLLTRDQRPMAYRELDPGTGVTTLVRAVTDAARVELLPGTPRRLADGRLLHSLDEGDTRRLRVDDDAALAEIVPQLGSVAVAQHLPTTLEVTTTVARGGNVVGRLDAVTAVSPLLPDLLLLQVDFLRRALDL